MSNRIEVLKVGKRAALIASQTLATLAFVFTTSPALAQSASTGASTGVGIDTKILENRLRPFTSDGCSEFPNAVPGLKSVSWLHCCIQHDVAYWKGGDARERSRADESLRACVSDVGGRALGDVVFAGVRVGGNASLPTSWNWGYGWTIPRGYAPLNSSERQQATELSAQIPANLETIPLVKTVLAPVRSTLTGDYCLDEAVSTIEASAGRGFKILEKTEVRLQHADGTLRRLQLQTDLCVSPFIFDFLLLRPDACTTPMTEILARGRIRMSTPKLPDNCPLGSTAK